MLTRALLIFTLAVSLFKSGNCSGYYTIVGPENIRPHSDYRISVSVHNQSEPVTVRLTIDDGDKLNRSTEITVVENETRTTTIRLDDLSVNRNHKLTAEGLSGLIFKNTSNLNVESKNYSIFIQTDKAIYKPGEKIRFRILVLNFNLQPVELNTNQLKVYVTNSNDNRIKQYRDVALKRGIFSNELQLSEFPVLGDWVIHAEIDDEVTSKSIEVAEYVLPKFSVKIDSSEHFNVKDGKIRAIIRSTYTYGQFVKGHAIVSLVPSSYFAWSSRKNADAIVKTIKIDGKGTAEFDIADDLDFKSDEYQRSVTYEMKAVVIEELTGRNQSESKRINVHQQRYKIMAIDRNSQFQTGLPIKVSVAVTYQDDKPVTNEKQRDIFIIKVPNNRNLSETNFKYQLAENGTVQLNIPTSKKDESGFTLMAKYDDEQAEIGYFYPRPTADESNLAVKVLTKNPALNKEIFVEVQSISLLTHFTYQLVSQGKLIASDSVEVPERKYHVFSFLATFELAPKAHLIVYYFKNDEIISARIDIELRDELQNFVKLKLSSAKVAPGDNVNIDVTTNPNSYVGLLGVDQSVLLLKKNAELTAEDAFNERELYQYRFHDKMTTEKQEQTPYYHNSYWNDFRSSRVILFTNAKKDVYPVIRDYNLQTVLFNKAGVQEESDSGIAFAAQPGVFHSHPVKTTAATFTSGQVQPPKVRKEFPETWLWQEVDVDNGTLSIAQQVPDTITSWVVSAFSLDPITGLGLTKVPRTLEVFQPFFVSLNLPYSMKRGEILAVPVIVFNYLENDLNVEITLHNEHDEFDFVDDDMSSEGENNRKKMVSIASNNGASSNFLIKPKKIGSITIKVATTSELAGDAVERILHVEPEGVAQFTNKAILIDLKETNSFDGIISSELPDDVVPDSIRAEISCVGDLFGNTIKNLHRLIRLPSGCGEQNMLNFVPNIVILDYLKATGQSKPEIEERAKRYTEQGYQRELTYRHNDGSFSAFGKLDKSGSTWLTAFVAKSFNQAKKYVDIDDKIIESSLQWLSNVQTADGRFPEVGQVSHKSMQGGSSNGIALTSYVLTAFVEARNGSEAYAETIDKAIDSIVDSLDDNQDDIYSLAIVAYALQLADHPRKGEVLDKLQSKAQTKNDRKWLSKMDSENKKENSKTLDVEITAYGLLATLLSDDYSDGLPYFKWLLAQRNDRGGFYGTQDTVVGLRALAEFAERVYVKDNNVQMVVKTKDANETNINVNSQNAYVLQTFEVSPEVRSIEVHANGHGFALLQLSHHYYLDNADVEPSFKIVSKLGDKTTEERLNLEVCVSFIPKEKSEKESNMVVMEVSLPSGFTVDSDLIYTLSKDPNVKKVETKNSDTVVVLYFDKFVADEPVCQTIDTFRSFKVAEQKPASIVVYDYYDSSKKSREFYTIPTKTACDICEDSSCAKMCK